MAVIASNWIEDPTILSVQRRTGYKAWKTIRKRQKFTLELTMNALERAIEEEVKCLTETYNGLS
jgi:hypothetical protein